MGLERKVKHASDHSGLRNHDRGATRLEGRSVPGYERLYRQGPCGARAGEVPEGSERRVRPVQGQSPQKGRYGRGSVLAWT